MKASTPHPGPAGRWGVQQAGVQCRPEYEKAAAVQIVPDGKHQLMDLFRACGHVTDEKPVGDGLIEAGVGSMRLFLSAKGPAYAFSLQVGIHDAEIDESAHAALQMGQDASSLPGASRSGRLIVAGDEFKGCPPLGQQKRDAAPGVGDHAGGMPIVASDSKAWWASR
jgi:hypothetical protein